MILALLLLIVGQAPSPADSVGAPGAAVGDGPADTGGAPPAATGDGAAGDGNASSAPAAADPWADWLTHFAFDVGAGTAVPASVGFDLHVEGPAGLFVDGSAGFMPAAYFSAINAVVVATGAYDQATADFLEEALANAFVLRLGGGVRPVPFLGLEIHAGYFWARGWGNVSTAATLELLTGSSSPALENFDTEFPAESAVHAFVVGLRYRFVPWDFLSIAVELSYLQAFAGDSRIVDDELDLQGGPRVVAAQEKALAELSTALDQYLDGIYGSYVKAPLVGVNVSYHFSL
jgi:hypothetical protein